jgi:hypothetical protein
MIAVKSWAIATFLATKHEPLSIEPGDQPVFWLDENARATKQVYHGIVAELNAAVRKVSAPSTSPEAAK